MTDYLLIIEYLPHIPFDLVPNWSFPNMSKGYSRDVRPIINYFGLRTHIAIEQLLSLFRNN